MLISDLKKLWKSNEVQHFDNETSDEEDDDVHPRRDDSRYFLLFEAAFESAPQFIIQLYVMAVQQESVTIVQIVSLPVSFLSLARASVVADEVLHYDDRSNDRLNMNAFITFEQSTLCSCFGDCELQHRVVGLLFFRVSLHSSTNT